MKCKWVVEGNCTNQYLINRYPNDTKCNGRFSNERKYCFCPSRTLRPEKYRQNPNNFEKIREYLE